MKSRKKRRALSNPFFVWTEVAMKTSEMLLASAQVISHRTARMAAAGPNPSARDRKEFQRMGQEKIDAAGESLQAMTYRMVAANQQMGALLFRQMTAGAGNFFLQAATRTLAESSRGNAELMRKTLSASAAVTSQLSQSAAEVARHGMKPVHGRATANAKRLSGVGKARK